MCHYKYLKVHLNFQSKKLIMPNSIFKKSGTSLYISIKMNRKNMTFAINNMLQYFYKKINILKKLIKKNIIGICSDI